MNFRMQILGISSASLLLELLTSLSFLSLQTVTSLYEEANASVYEEHIDLVVDCIAFEGRLRPFTAHGLNESLGATKRRGCQQRAETAPMRRAQYSVRDVLGSCAKMPRKQRRCLKKLGSFTVGSTSGQKILRIERVNEREDRCLLCPFW
jgi:hypothetical protein